MLMGEGKIDDHHRMGAGPDDDLAVVDHLFEGRRNSRIAPRHDHRHAVADEDAVDPGAVDEFGGRPVVGGDHRQATFVPFRSREIGEGNAAGGVRHSVRIGKGGGRTVGDGRRLRGSGIVGAGSPVWSGRGAITKWSVAAGFRTEIGGLHRVGQRSRPVLEARWSSSSFLPGACSAQGRWRPSLPVRSGSIGPTAWGR